METTMATKKVTIEVEIPEGAENILKGVSKEKLAETAVKIMLANLLAAEAGLSKEEAIWLEEQVKKELARKHS
jgi:hypothetical protein